MSSETGFPLYYNDLQVVDQMTKTILIPLLQDTN